MLKKSMKVTEVMELLQTRGKLYVSPRFRELMNGLSVVYQDKIGVRLHKLTADACDGDIVDLSDEGKKFPLNVLCYILVNEVTKLIEGKSGDLCKLNTRIVFYIDDVSLDEPKAESETVPEKSLAVSLECYSGIDKTARISVWDLDKETWVTDDVVCFPV
jgi:hypothetical protein